MRAVSSARGMVGLILLAALGVSAAGDPGAIPFDEENWDLGTAEVVEHLGRPSLKGRAVLRDRSFREGVILVDIALTGARGYPGIQFRSRSAGFFETVYVRPHRSGEWDALQYAPAFHGATCWQLYGGQGHTGAAELPTGRWISLRLEVRGSQARLTLDDATEPALVVSDLKHGEIEGPVTLASAADGSVHFSNFRILPAEPPAWPARADPEAPPGTILDWELSPAYPLSGWDLETYPSQERLEEIPWEPVRCEPDGVLNISRHRARTGREPDVALVRSRIPSDRARILPLALGYSDAATLFCNGRPLYTGNSAYHRRDPSFLGIMGLHDVVYLPLQEGSNELLIMVAESFGGWGLRAQDRKAEFIHPSLEPLWETGPLFRTPESVVIDPATESLFVSGFDVFAAGGEPDSQLVSRLSLDGEIQDLSWGKGMTQPTGMAIHRKRLLVVQRRALVELHRETGRHLKSHPIPDAVFPNDVAVDASGLIYVSDSGRNLIYRLRKGRWEEWLTVPEIVRPNGLCILADELVVGCNGDGSLRGVNLRSREVRVLARLGEGIIDGIQPDGQGGLLVSQWEGRLLRIDPEGGVQKLLDSTAAGRNCADFGWAPELRLLVIPTFGDDRLRAFRLGD